MQCFRVGLGNEGFVFSIPIWLVRFIFTIFGRKKMYNQLYKSFYLENKKLKNRLGWVPEDSPVEKLKEIALKRRN